MAGLPICTTDKETQQISSLDQLSDQFTGSSTGATGTGAGTGKVEQSLPCCSRPVNESKVDQIMGIGVTRLWEAHKDAEKNPPIFCNLIIVVMTLLKSGRLETG